jgi:hypothetical protein
LQGILHSFGIASYVNNQLFAAGQVFCLR